MKVVQLLLTSLATLLFTVSAQEIRGYVVTEDDEPIYLVLVTAYFKDSSGAMRSLPPAQTDNEGFFRIPLEGDQAVDKLLFDSPDTNRYQGGILEIGLSGRANHEIHKVLFESAFLEDRWGSLQAYYPRHPAQVRETLMYFDFNLHLYALDMPPMPYSLLNDRERINVALELVDEALQDEEVIMAFNHIEHVSLRSLYDHVVRTHSELGTLQ